VRCFSRK